MRRSTRDWMIRGGAILCLLGQLVLAFWPVPGKYPWVLPAVLLAAAAAAVYRERRHADDVGSALIPLGALCALALWTLMYQETQGTGTLLLCVVMFGLPVVWLVMALIYSGSADNPYEDEQ